VANLILIQASLTGQPLTAAVELTSRLNKVELKAGLRIRIQSGQWIRIQEGKNDVLDGLFLVKFFFSCNFFLLQFLVI
jgi:hypothetical protein